MIEMEIVPFISKTRRGFAPTGPVGEIVNAILYKLKTGVQWNGLPIRPLFSGVFLSWQSVCHHYRKWCLCGTWKDFWTKFPKKHRAELELSRVDLDDGHTPAIRGGHSVEYQGGKKRKTTSALYPTHREGLPLAMSEPVAGNHNDLYYIGVLFEVVTATLEKAEIPVRGCS